MSEWFQTLKLAIRDFDGIIGTILGVVLGSWITRVNRSYGRTSAFVSRWHMAWFKQDQHGNLVLSNRSVADRARIEARIAFYNSRDIPVGLLLVRWSFRQGTAAICQWPVRCPSRSGEELTVLNLPPHQLVEIDARGDIDLKAVPSVRDADSVWLVAITHRRKPFEVKVGDL